MRTEGLLAKGAAVLVAAFVVAPMILVVVMSFGSGTSFRFPPQTFTLNSYLRYFSEARWMVPTLNSVIIASASAILTLLVTAPAAFAFARYELRFRRVIRLLIMAPLMVPYIVMALAYFFFLGRIGLINTMPGVIIAHSCLAVPLVFLILTAGLKSFDWTLVRASQIAGASPFQTFRHVYLPLLRPSFLVAGLFSFVNSFDETVIALFISGRAASTLPRRMFESVRQESDPVIAAVSTLLFLLVAAAAIGVAWRQRHRERRRKTAVGPL
jgi:putative spermidine/putrescine transport system permease protein